MLGHRRTGGGAGEADAGRAARQVGRRDEFNLPCRRRWLAGPAASAGPICHV